MSKGELGRLTADLNANQALADKMTAKGENLEAIVQLARAEGYAITVDDVREHLASQRHELSDETLDEVAAGRSAIPRLIVRVIEP